MCAFVSSELFTETACYVGIISIVIKFMSKYILKMISIIIIHNKTIVAILIIIIIYYDEHWNAEWLTQRSALLLVAKL